MHAQYILGHDQRELERLERQAAILAPATRTLMTMAGVRSGMRVLDLGTGTGDVAFLGADLVGPGGEVVGIDRASAALEAARARAHARGLANVRFEEGDIQEFEDGEFDVIVGRLVLMYTRDAASVVRHHTRRLRPGGVLLAMEFDAGAARAIPSCPAVTQALSWVLGAFDHAGADLMLGSRLSAVFDAAGLPGCTTLGIQLYLPPEPAGAMVAGIVRTLAAEIERAGLATADEIDIDTLAQRLGAEMQSRHAVFAPPTLVGAWTSVP